MKKMPGSLRRFFSEPNNHLANYHLPTQLKDRNDLLNYLLTLSIEYIFNGNNFSAARTLERIFKYFPEQNGSGSVVWNAILYANSVRLKESNGQFLYHNNPEQTNYRQNNIESLYDMFAPTHASHRVSLQLTSLKEKYLSLSMTDAMEYCRSLIKKLITGTMTRRKIYEMLCELERHAGIHSDFRYGIDIPRSVPCVIINDFTINLGSTEHDIFYTLAEKLIDEAYRGINLPLPGTCNAKSDLRKRSHPSCLSNEPLYSTAIIYQTVKKIQKKLRKNSIEPALIQNIPDHGYRLNNAPWRVHLYG